ncbi:hypothetical protein GOODEAATRI_028422, partial [Goodea atripinnis]
LILPLELFSCHHWYLILGTIWEGISSPLSAEPTCEVLQGRTVHPEAQHLLDRQVNGIIPAHGSAAARVRSPLYRIAELGFGRRHGGGRAGGVRRLSPARGGWPLPVPLLRLDVRLRCGKGRAAGWSVGPRWCGLCGGHDVDSGGGSRRAVSSSYICRSCCVILKGPAASLRRKHLRCRKPRCEWQQRDARTYKATYLTNTNILKHISGSYLL